MMICNNMPSLAKFLIVHAEREGNVLDGRLSVWIEFVLINSVALWVS